MQTSKPVPPGRKKNGEMRSREYLNEQEVEKLRRAAERLGRHGERDATMILLAYRHGLRASELVGLEWTQIDLEQRVMHVRRAKNGVPSTHPLTRSELKAIRNLSRKGPHVFTNERGGPLSVSGFAKIVERAGEVAELGLKCHPHMLRHACGFKLANDGVDTRTIQSYLGHRNIQATVIYTQLAPQRFRGLWKD
jgi:type 1 fimbriae regulatory protein FimB/type 1 fimbriae regulatory protein FimE